MRPGGRLWLEGGCVTAETAGELGRLKSKWEDMDKTQDENCTQECKEEEEEGKEERNADCRRIISMLTP